MTGNKNKYKNVVIYKNFFKLVSKRSNTKK